MTVTDVGAIVDALVEVTPAALDRDFARYGPAKPGTVGWAFQVADRLGVEPKLSKPVARCLTASRAGIEALRYFGVEAIPVPVEALVGNPAFVENEDALTAGTITGQEAFDRGVRYLQTDLVSANDNGWPGHMLVGLPEQDVLLDLDLNQFNRPEKNIVLPRAASFAVSPEFWTTPRAWSSYLVDGCRILYRRVETDPWIHAPDWRKHGPRVAGPVIRKVKETLR